MGKQHHIPKEVPDRKLGLMSEVEVAHFLNLRPNTLAHWRLTKLQPLPFIRIGRTIRYRLEDVERFLQQRQVAEGGGEA
jgi:hypothetical protein